MDLYFHTKITANHVSFLAFFRNYSGSFGKEELCKGIAGLRARRREEKLERVVKYNEEAFNTAWDYVGSSSNDDEGG